MGNRNWQGVIWSIVTVVLLLSYLVPTIIFTIPFIMVPVVMLYVKTSGKQFAVYYAVSMLLLGLLGINGLFLISLSLFFLPPVIVMGNLYKRRAAARSVLTAGTVTLLAEALFALVVSFAVGFNPIAKFRQSLLDNLNALPPAFRESLFKDQDWYINTMIQAIPVVLILFAVFYVFITHGVSRRLLNRSGEAIPGLRPMREWMLPRSFVWIYLIAVVLDLFTAPNSESLMSTLLLNLLMLFVPVFAIQAICFLFFIAHQKGWNRALPIVAIVLVFFMPPFMYIYSLLGVFDVAFPIRERFKKKL